MTKDIIKIEAVDASLGIDPVYAERFAEYGSLCVDRGMFTKLLDAWSDGHTTRGWDELSASDDEDQFVAAEMTTSGIRLTQLRPVGDGEGDESLWEIGSLPFETKVTELTASQAASFADEGEPFSMEDGFDNTETRLVVREGGEHVQVGITLGAHWSHLQPDMPVIQIDTQDHTGRLRIVLNEHEIWEGDPETDGPQG